MKTSVLILLVLAACLGLVKTDEEAMHCACPYILYPVCDIDGNIHASNCNPGDNCSEYELHPTLTANWNEHKCE